MNENMRYQLEKLLANDRLDDHQLRLKVSEILDFQDQESKTNSCVKLQDLMEQSIQEMAQTDFGGKVIETGFKEFDRQHAGFLLGELVVIGARPGMGATQLLVNLAMNFSVKNPVLFASYDMSDFMLSTRFMSHISGFSTDQLMLSRLSPIQKNHLLDRIKQFVEHAIIVGKPENSSITSFKKFCIEQVEKHGVKVIILDSIQRLTHHNYRNNRELEVNYVVSELKNLAKELDICVIASSQLSRSVEMRGGSKRPRLSDLRDSGGIEQSADKVIFLYRPSYYGLSETKEGFSTERLMEFILAKNTNGLLSTTYLFHDRIFRKISDASTDLNEFEFAPNRLDELDSDTPPDYYKTRNDAEDDVPF